MGFPMKRLQNSMVLLICSAVAILISAGCASKAPMQPAYQETKAEPVLAQITGINTEVGADSVSVNISGSKVLTYTSVKQPAPLGVVLYFPETTIGTLSNLQDIQSDLIQDIKTSELTSSGQTARVEIVLSQDVPYTANRDGNGLKITFPKPMMTAQAAADIKEEAPPKVAEKATEEAKDDSRIPQSKEVPAPMVTKSVDASMLSAVTGTEEDNQAVIHVAADGAIKNYKSFTLPHPPRIVFELMDVKSAHSTQQSVSIGDNWVTRARHYGYPDKVRLVLETKQAYLSNYTATPAATGLVIKVGEADQQDRQEVVAVTAANTEDVSQEAPPEKVKASETPEKKSKQAGWVNRIDFSSEEAGKSTVIIGTTAQADYKLDKVSDRLLHLTLFNAKLPDYRERPLITTRFESAVDRILPMKNQGANENSLFTIELRESVPYFIEQKDNLLMVHFEASTVPPKSLTDQEMPAFHAELSESSNKKTSLSENNATPVSVIAEEETNDYMAKKPVKKYTGEKIALDFYETDIKNVFRILREISARNFAIDKDVTGKVTLAFDKPVPWDQVLDLILKMNQLGSTMEGDIIRIATLETLRKEEDERQAALIAAQKSKEQELALEPLLTEYIPVNYSNASDEVLPHLEKIITEDRGMVGVDERNNLIIITDVSDKIRQAREIVKQLDRVTPQVIIEARVVEVNSEFTSDLGIDWSISQTGVQKDFLGGTYNWDAVMNFPAASDSSIGFSFARIAGTPLVLDARLSAIETDGKGKIVSAPKIVTLDNKKAKIKQGVEVPYLERDDSGGSSTKFKNVDLLLEVTPHVTPDRRVSMMIYITKNDIGTVFEGTPSLNTNEAETELLVNDGETIVIGGILKIDENVSTSGFPGLSNVPGLGWLFKQEKKTETKRELLIFITPKIVQLAQR